MQRRHLAAVVRWSLAVGIVGWAAWQLSTAWSATAVPAVVGGAAAAAGALALSAAALVALASTSAFGVRATRTLPDEPPGRLWLRWMRVWFPSYFYRYVPGKLMLVAERVRLGRRLGIPAATSVVLVLWESGLLLAGSAAFGAVALLVRAPPPDAHVSRPAVAAFAVATLGGCLAFPIVLRALARARPTLAARIPGLVFDVAPAAQLLLVLANAACWGLLGLSFAATVRLFAGGVDVDAATLVMWFVASYVVGQISSVTPAGIGVREAVLVTGLAGAAPAPAILAWGVAHRVVLALAEGGLVLLSLAVPIPRPPDDGAVPPR